MAGRRGAVRRRRTPPAWRWTAVAVRAFKRDGEHTAVSNAVFDSSLRDNNPEWGVRDTAELEKLAVAAGLELVEIAEMPANNLILVFGRSQAA